MSVRTVYRDLRAIDEEIGVPSGPRAAGGASTEKAFLPPLKLTQSEAMAVVLSARLMVRYADKYDPDLAAAFEKLEEVLPAAAGRARRADPRRPVQGAARRRGSSQHVHLLTKAWAERRVVTIEYEPAGYAPDAAPRRAIVRPYLIEPSLQTHALYLIGWDETRDALRTFKIERIRDVALTPQTFEPPDRGAIETALRRAWDIIADQDAGGRRLRFAPTVAARVTEATWHPTQRLELEPDGSLLWRATVSGTIEDPSLDPVLGRRRGGARTARAPRRRSGDPSPGRCAIRRRSKIERRLCRLSSRSVLLAVSSSPVVGAVTDRRSEYRILGWINQARAERGPRDPCAPTTRLWDLAGDRADRMASTNS